MFFERRTARGPPSRKKRCRPSPRTAPPPPLLLFSTPASLSAPPRAAMAPTARKYTPISRPCSIQEYRNLSFPAPIRGNLVLLADDASVPGYAHDRPMEFRLMEHSVVLASSVKQLLSSAGSMGMGKKQFEGLRIIIILSDCKRKSGSC